MVVALVVMLVPLFAAVAFAADQLIYCKSVPCYGTSNDDKIYERKGNGVFDKIIMKGGHDLVLANGYTNDTDRVKGGSGYDKINVADGDRDDTIFLTGIGARKESRFLGWYGSVPTLRATHQG